MVPAGQHDMESRMPQHTVPFAQAVPGGQPLFVQTSGATQNVPSWQQMVPQHSSQH
jgi:hypothetical protein